MTAKQQRVIRHRCNRVEYYKRFDGSCVACESVCEKSDANFAESVNASIARGDTILFAGKLSRFLGEDT